MAAGSVLLTMRNKNLESLHMYQVCTVRGFWLSFSSQDDLHTAPHLRNQQPKHPLYGGKTYQYNTFKVRRTVKDGTKMPSNFQTPTLTATPTPTPPTQPHSPTTTPIPAPTAISSTMQQLTSITPRRLRGSRRTEPKTPRHFSNFQRNSNPNSDPDSRRIRSM